MSIGNLAKSIAFASLWAYAAIVSQGVPQFDERAKIWFLTAVMSFVVIYLFDRGPDRKQAKK